MRAGANVKAANRYGVTPLSLACTNGNAAMVELLLEAGADREHHASRRRNGVDDRGAHGALAAGEVAARARRQRRRERRPARPDRADVGRGGRARGGRRAADRGGRRFPHAAGLGIHAAVVRRARRPHRRRARAAEGRRRRQRDRDRSQDAGRGYGGRAAAGGCDAVAAGGR